MKSINVVIPIAGQGSRFQKKGYTLPKPFIDVEGKMMIERVLSNLTLDNARYILIAREEHITSYPEKFSYLEKNYHNVEFVQIPRLTHGAACTVLAGHRLINNDTPLLIANSDQLVDCSIDDFITDSENKGLDGSILVFPDSHPKWSYVELNKQGQVLRLREKEVISNHATVGIYYFHCGSDFVDGVLDMIASADTVNDEFYVAPVYNHLITQKKKFGVYKIKKASMHGIGTPEDLNIYLENSAAAVA